jgi:hypothetical protein
MELTVNRLSRPNRDATLLSSGSVCTGMETVALLGTGRSWRCVPVRVTPLRRFGPATLIYFGARLGTRRPFGLS